MFYAPTLNTKSLFVQYNSKLHLSVWILCVTEKYKLPYTLHVINPFPANDILIGKISTYLYNISILSQVMWAFPSICLWCSMLHLNNHAWSFCSLFQPSASTVCILGPRSASSSSCLFMGSVWMRKPPPSPVPVFSFLECDGAYYNYIDGLWAFFYDVYTLRKAA